MSSGNNTSSIKPFEEEILKMAISLAIHEREAGGKPFGAVLALRDKVVYSSYDKRREYYDPTSHAELCVISEYCRNNKLLTLEGHTLYTSTEPCAMCAGAIRSSGLSKVIFSVSQTMLQSLSGGWQRPKCAEIAYGPSEVEIIGPILPEFGLKAFDNYFFKGGEKMDPKWLNWAKRLQSISQDGLLYSDTPYHKERYEDIREIALEIIAEGAEADIKILRNLYSKEEGYATPKVDSRGVVFRDNALLFVKERDDDRWSLPGGWYDPYESPSDGVEKEILEESGFKTKATKLLGVYDRSKHAHSHLSQFHLYTLYFKCEIISGSPSASLETKDVGFFKENEIPNLSLYRVTKGLIRRMFEHGRKPDMPTDFD